MRLEEIVNRNLAKLNPTDLMIWRYIYQHRKECCYISIYDLASACNVSRTTILRFAKKLSLDGFSDLKMLLKMDVESATAAPLMDITKATLQLCRQAGEEIAKQDFTRVNELMYRAKRIFIYPSGFVQENVAHEIIRLFINCNLMIYEIKGPDEFQTILRKASPDDLFIIVSLSGESRRVTPVAEKLHAQDIPLISLTRLKSNTLARLSTENIYITPIAMPTALDTTYESMLMFFLAVEVWFVSYCRYLLEQADEKA